MKDRKHQRENRRWKHREKGLEKNNLFGIKDMTAYNAVQRIRLESWLWSSWHKRIGRISAARIIEWFFIAHF